MALLDASVVSFVALIALLFVTSNLLGLLLSIGVSTLIGVVFHALVGKHKIPPKSKEYFFQTNNKKENLSCPFSLCSSGAVIITGCSSGIGRTAALSLASKGIVVFAGVRKLQDTQSLQALSPNIVPMVVDITMADQVNQAAQFVEEQLKVRGLGLLGLVNNAGMCVVGFMETQSLATVREQFEVGVFGPLQMTKACLPLLRKYHVPGHRPRVVMVTSGSALLALPVIGAYCSSKAAMESLADSLRVELKPWDIEVVSVIPGPINTPIHETFRGDNLTTAVTSTSVEHEDPAVTSRYRTALKKFQQMAGLVPFTFVSTDVSDAAFEACLLDRWPRAKYDVGLLSMTSVRIARLLPSRLVDLQNSL